MFSVPLHPRHIHAQMQRTEMTNIITSTSIIISISILDSCFILIIEINEYFNLFDFVLPGANAVRLLVRKRVTGNFDIQDVSFWFCFDLLVLYYLIFLAVPRLSGVRLDETK